MHTLALLAALLALDPHVARNRGAGSSVTLEGFVTLPSGRLSFMTGDNGFVLGDNLTGIYIQTNEKTYYSLGTAVEAVGTLTDNGRGMLVLRARTIRYGKGRSLVKPWPVARPVLDEFYEGRIVRTEGEVVRIGPSPYGQKLFVRREGKDMQVLVPGGVEFRTGQKLRVTGFCAEDNGVYQIIARTAKDIDEIGK